MTVIIENEKLTAVIAEEGAELVSLKDRDSGIEYIWQGNPAFWGRHAPVLFPFVGRLKNDQYSYKNKSYSLGQHGFARDQVFDVIEKGEGSVSLSLKSTKETKKVYPFDFELVLSYAIEGTELVVSYQVINTGKEEMLFSIGGHPAFNIPLEKHLTFNDYYLSLAPKMNRIQIPLSGPFADLEHKTLGQTVADLDLNRELFVDDALIYETPGKTAVTIKSDGSEHSVTLKYEDIPFVGIWSPYEKEAPFVCIEPWWGIADTVNSDGQLEDKSAVNQLKPAEEFKTNYVISVK
ncbi:aldose 1-epimerase family protein [Enterococcus sp. BWT-B8]|uniref:aldose 1-epimerase family protein n=1 Tax=Enterococcus sp. BWT-B8 TaxID=2885157 RepID=UPI001E31B53C|nr:aldose 1-epimerase family protein [Enterococcus sp. BWT-B8]MCB5950691.1 aldose 1-epimerase family protein [Enterococcus sp. BWT-B8]